MTRAGHPLLVAAALAAVPTAAAGSDAALRDVVSRQLPVAASALDGARPGNPDGTQRAYDAARDLQVALSAVGPTPGCRALAAAARRFAGAAVEVPERIDRLESSSAARGRAAAALAEVRATGCTPRGGGRPPKPGAPGISPGPGEAFFGSLVADAPRGGAETGTVVVRGREVVTGRVVRGRLRVRLVGAPGRYDLRVRFTRAGRVVGERRADGVWLLPAASLVARPGARTDPARARDLRSLGAAAPATVGLYVQDLRTGTAAGWNDTTAFPAASTTKLGLMVAALQRAGANPGSSPVAYEVRQIGVWSSNLATNRLLVRLGGSEDAGAALAQDALRRMDARSSTFTGGYVVGTELQPGLPSDGPRRAVPRVSGRVTTAADMARMLYAIHAAATGDRAARSQTGLTTRAARVLLGHLLASEQAGDNRSLVQAGLPRGTVVAQKNGWLRAARHGAALVYTPAGPRIVVLLSYRDGGLSRAEAAAVGARLAGIAVR